MAHKKILNALNKIHLGVCVGLFLTVTSCSVLDRASGVSQNNGQVEVVAPSPAEQVAGQIRAVAPFTPSPWAEILSGAAALISGLAIAYSRIRSKNLQARILKLENGHFSEPS